jgi:hypothetical protein
MFRHVPCTTDALASSSTTTVSWRCSVQHDERRIVFLEGRIEEQVMRIDDVREAVMNLEERINRRFELLEQPTRPAFRRHRPALRSHRRAVRSGLRASHRHADRDHQRHGRNHRGDSAQITRTLAPSHPRTLAPLHPWTLGPLDPWTLGPLHPWTLGVASPTLRSYRPPGFDQQEVRPQSGNEIGRAIRTHQFRGASDRRQR